MTAILKVDTIQDTAGNNIINENANTVTIGKAGDTVNVVGTLQNNSSALVSGITGADQWRITADHSGVGDVTANWERADSDGFNYIGTGMTESSGIFTFPETGIWSIQFISMPYVSGTDTAYLLSTIETTTDNSTYGTASRSYVSLYETTAYSNANCYFIFDVTNTTTHKCKFKLAQNQAGTPIFQGQTEHNSTFATFIRLGDT